MLEILQYVTSGFWVFVGSTIFTAVCLEVIGWAINAAIVGFRGIKVKLF